ncbi:MAG: DUF423 domain-containing protein [Flavobacterium sp.]
MDSKLIAAGAIFGATAIILGAFGAHALKEELPAASLVVFETGVKYQMYHALFLLLAGLMPMVSAGAKKIIFRLTVTGVLFFSGSLYFLSCQTLFGVNLKFLGPVTPIGGLLLILAWAVLFLNIIRAKR